MFDIDWMETIRIFSNLALAGVLGAVIGWEREKSGSQAGIRTYGFIALGACAFGTVSALIPNADPARVAAQVVTGIGFICAGVIFKEGANIAGLTTAASLWSTAAVGLAASFSYYNVAIITAFIMFTALNLSQLTWWNKLSAKGNGHRRKKSE